MDEKVTPTALRGFHFDLRVSSEPGEDKTDSEVSCQSFICKFIHLPWLVALRPSFTQGQPVVRLMG